MSYLVVTMTTNWADEFDIDSFTIISKEDFEKGEAELAKYNGEISICFGTNEDIVFKNGQEVLDIIETKEISKELADTISTTIGNSWGLVTFERVLENLYYYLSK